MDPNTRALMMGAAGSGGPATYVEDVFQTWLYTGTGATQTITNGIDLAGKGGLVWTKDRSNAIIHTLIDTVRGAGNYLVSSSTQQQFNVADAITSFNSTGYDLGSRSWLNASADAFASWTFRKQAKFFDVVTYTGNATNRTIAHDLGSTPGCIIIKRTNVGGNWFVYHRGLSNPALDYINLNTTSAALPNFPAFWNSTAPTSTVFSLGTEADINANGGTYVAYLFAHDAGGFGASGSDSVIKCGSFTTDGSGNATVNLGWEPQWVLIKATATAGNSWVLQDTMRGFRGASGNTAFNFLYPDLSNAEVSGSGNYGGVTSTGFQMAQLSASEPYIYIAIRRGPMKTPTDATKVFQTVTRTGTGAAFAVTSAGFPPDLVAIDRRSGGGAGVGGTYFWDKTRGAGQYIASVYPDAEASSSNSVTSFDMSGYSAGSMSMPGTTNASGVIYINWMFRRAPGFFDVVAYTGTGATLSVSHNLQVAPELMIVKSRNTPGGSNYSWTVYSAALGNSSRVFLNNDFASGSTTTMWNGTTPGSSSFTVGTSGFTNDAAGIYIAYLFASCPGVSKVGSYTGTGTTLNIDCGFTNGARLVLIKRTDSTGDWYIWDTARGIIAANDPYLLLNSTAAEVTNTDYIDPLSSGFQISSTAPAAINANGGSYIYLSVA